MIKLVCPNGPARNGTITTCVQKFQPRHSHGEVFNMLSVGALPVKKYVNDGNSLLVFFFPKFTAISLSGI